MLLAYRYTTVHTAALLYRCSGLVGGWWVHGVLSGGLMDRSVRGLIVSCCELTDTSYGTINNTIRINCNMKIPDYYRTYCCTAAVLLL